MSINEMNKEVVRKEYLDFLKECLKEHCNKEMCCEIYWDYWDDIDPSTLKEVADGYKEAGYENPKDYLSIKLWELNMDYDSYMFDEIEKEIRNGDNEKVIEYFESFGNLYEDAQEVGYNGIDVCVDEILGKSEFCLNIMFGTDTERNYDMGSIVSSFGSWREPDFEYLENNTDDLDNALTYLIHQQGHSVKEVYDCLLNNEKGFGSSEKMDFVKSVVNDIVNNSSDAVSELCALVKLDGNQYFELLEAVDKGEQYLSFKKDTMIGIFNEWAGCGGLLEVELDKSFVVPVDMVRNVQVEGVRSNLQNYTVDSVYGLIGSCWKETLSYTDEKPVLYEEDLAETVKAAKEFVEERDGQEEKPGLDDVIASAESQKQARKSAMTAIREGYDEFSLYPNEELEGIDLVHGGGKVKVNGVVYDLHKPLSMQDAIKLDELPHRYERHKVDEYSPCQDECMIRVSVSKLPEEREF